MNLTFRLTAREITEDGQSVWSGTHQWLGESYGVTYATRKEANAALEIAQLAADYSDREIEILLIVDQT